MTPIQGSNTQALIPVAENTNTNQKTSTANFSRFFKFLAFLPFTTLASATSISNSHREVSLTALSPLSENTADVAFSTFHGVENSSNPRAPLFSQEHCYLSEDTAEYGSSIVEAAQNISSESNESTFNRWSEMGSGSTEALGMLAITGLAFLIDDNRIKTAKLKAAIKKLTESNNKIEEQRDIITESNNKIEEQRDIITESNNKIEELRDIIKDKEELNINYRSMISDLTDGLRALKIKLKESNKKIEILQNLIEEIEKLNEDQERDELFSVARINLLLSNIGQFLDSIESGATRLVFNTESPLFPPFSSEN